MKRIRFSFILFWLANSAVLFLADRPNILFLFADDMRADTIAAHGNPHIRTPYFDSLAASGFSFRANYIFGGSSGAVCVPSRGHQPKRTPQPREAVMTGGLVAAGRRSGWVHTIGCGVFPALERASGWGRSITERTETVETRAEQTIAAQLKRRRWQEVDLQTRPKGNTVKVALATRLRAEPTLTGGWMAERPGRSARGHLNQLLYRRRKADGQ